MNRLSDILVLVLSLVATNPSLSQTPTSHTTLDPSILTAEQSAAIPSFARGYQLRAASDGRLWLYLRQENTDIYAQPAAWQDLRYLAAAGTVRPKGELPGAVVVGGVTDFGVLAPPANERPIAPIETNDPSFTPDRSGISDLLRDAVSATGDQPKIEEAPNPLHIDHAADQPCPGPGPCPNPNPTPTPNPYPPDPDADAAGIDPVIVLGVGAAVVLAGLVGITLIGGLLYLLSTPGNGNGE